MTCMPKRRAAASALIALAVALGVGGAAAAPVREPGGTTADAAMAIRNPDEYAWQVFFFLNRQARTGVAGEADPAKASIRNYDPDRDVVWETWALASGGLPSFRPPGNPNRSEVFLDRGAKPAAWADLPRKNGSIKVLDANLTQFTSAAREAFNSAPPANNPLVKPGATNFPGEFEVRMNRQALEYIRDNELYNVEGLEAKVRDGRRTGNLNTIAFPSSAKEIKAAWVRISEIDKPRYHWRTVTLRKADGTTATEVWGLAGMHIITKDLPNWLWSDFEHEDWVNKQPDGSPDPRMPIDSTTRDYASLGTTGKAGRNGVRRETLGSKWQHYRLRGTQIGFVDRQGNPTETSNTLLEPFSAGASSCMTCHARASVGIRADPTKKAPPPFVASTLFPEFIIGVPDPKLFVGTGGPQFLQTDYLWSMPFRAHSKSE